MSNYLSVTEVAKLVRKSLKESFPNVKFSVRCDKYSGGSSMNVNWVDGPNQEQVDAVVSIFKGSYFDGMIDYKGSRYHALDGEPVNFLGDFIFTNREYSDEAKAIAISKVVRQNGINEELTVEGFNKGAYYNKYPDGEQYRGVYDSIQQLIWNVLGKSSNTLVVKESPTRNRVTFLGDDGYGQGTVGNGDGVTAKGYPGC